MPMPIRSTSAGSTPTHTPQDCLAGVGGDVLEAFAQGESEPPAAEKELLFKLLPIGMNLYSNATFPLLMQQKELQDL